MRTTNVVVSASVTRNSGGIHRADRLFHVVADGEHRRRHDRAPASAAGGVKKASGETERVNAFSDAALLLAFQERLAQNDSAHDDEIGVDERLERVAGAREEPRARHAADHTGDGQMEKERLIHVFELDMGETGCERRRDLRHMDDRARERGGKPRHGFEKRPAAHAVGHAERAVDDLRGEADDDEKKKFTPVHSVSPPSR